MRTYQNPLGAALFGKARRRVLAALFGRPDEKMYVRQLARSAGVGLASVQRELRRLAAAGVLLRSVQGRQVYYQADPACPIFSELRSLTQKTFGMTEVLSLALHPLAKQIRVALVFGSTARGEERRGSDIDVLVVGAVKFAQVAAALGPTQNALGREVNPVVYPPSEFRRKTAAGNHFLSTVLRADKLFLIGDEHELARLAAKRMAD